MLKLKLQYFDHLMRRVDSLEKTDSSLDCKDIKPVNPKGNQSQIFIGRTEAEAEAPILWQPDAKADSLQKTLMLGKIEGKRISRE